MILLLGGTSETGRVLRELCLPQSDQPLPVLLCTATDEPLSIPAAVWSSGLARRQSGRLDRSGLCEVIRTNNIRLAISAVHPYAADARDTLLAAARDCEIPCLVYLRPGSALPPHPSTGIPGFSLPTAHPDRSCVLPFPAVEDNASKQEQLSAPANPSAAPSVVARTRHATEAGEDPDESAPRCAIVEATPHTVPAPRPAEVLTATNHTQAATTAVRIARERGGNILLTTGSRHLQEYAQAATVAGVKLYARVLDCPDARQSLAAAGIPPAQTIFGRGPFAEEENRRQIQESGAAVLVTKDGGDAGGIRQKLAAAAGCNCAVILIERPAFTGPFFSSLDALLVAVRTIASGRF